MRRAMLPTCGCGSQPRSHPPCMPPVCVRRSCASATRPSAATRRTALRQPLWCLLQPMSSHCAVGISQPGITCMSARAHAALVLVHNLALPWRDPRWWRVTQGGIGELAAREPIAAAARLREEEHLGDRLPALSLTQTDVAPASCWAPRSCGRGAGRAPSHHLLTSIRSALYGARGVADTVL
jgi:hypothetical protein